jgi:hypothetical protein
VEVRTLKTNTAIVIAIFLYECILTRFGCPLTIVTDHGVHFINNAIKYSKSFFVETCEFYNLLSSREWEGWVY